MSLAKQNTKMKKPSGTDVSSATVVDIFNKNCADGVGHKILADLNKNSNSTLIY